MTEEIIIDGVNVAGCEFYECEMCSAYKDCGYTDIMCKYDNQDCYYKQWQRLKQENETLTRENENRNDWITSLRKQCTKLVEEKLIYRSALEEIREIANENNFCASYACPPMFKILDKINEVLGDENN